MEHKLCGCPNDVPSSKKVLAELPPRPNRMTEPHFKIGGKTSPGRFSRHFYNMYPNSLKDDERSDRNSSSVPGHFQYYSDQQQRQDRSSPSFMYKSRQTLSPVKEHPSMTNMPPAVLITVILSTAILSIYHLLLLLLLAHANLQKILMQLLNSCYKSTDELQFAVQNR